MIRLIGAALAVALTLTLLAACGGQSTPEKGETAEFYSETHDEDGFDTVESVETVADKTDGGDTPNGAQDDANSKDEEHSTSTGGSTGGAIDLPKLPL